MFKKILTLVVAAIGIFTLASCDPADTGLTDAELLAQISEAMAELDVTTTTSSDLTLPNTGLHDVVITWESQNTDYIANDGTVTQPTKSEGNKTVTIVATLTLEEQALTKSFQVTVEAAADYNDAEKVAMDKAALFLQEGQLFADLTLPTSGSNGTTITWESDKPAYITNTGAVTRPAVGEGEELVTLTATITSGSETDTKEFQFRVQEDVEVNTIAELKSTASAGDNVLVRALVMGIFDQGAYIGYYIYDGTGFMYVHMGASSNTYNVSVGNVYQIAGEYDVYFGMPQLAYPTEEAEIDMEITMPAATVVTPADIMAYTTEVPKEKFSEYINITGTVTFDGTYYYLEDEAGNAIELNDDSDISLVIAELGKSVTMNGFYHSYHSSHGNHQISFTGNAADLTVNELPDAEALAADLAVIGASVPGATLMDVTLPTEGSNGTAFTGWTSSNTAIFDNDGTFVAAPTTTTTVTFTATATKGTETGTATIEVVVPAASTLAEANAGSLGDFFLVTGVVFSESYYGFHIWANDEFLFVSGTDELDNIAPGDELTLVLKFDYIYHDAAQFKILEYTNNSSGNALPTPEVVELSDVVNVEYPFGKLVTVTGEVVLEVGTYTDVFLADAAGNMIQVHYNSDADVIQAFDGQVITVDVILYGWDYIWFQGEAADVTPVTGGFDDADMAYAILADVVAGLGSLEGVASDFTFPATYEDSDPDATITWDSDTEAVVGDDGVVTIQNGTTGTATITVTVDYNGTTATKDLAVTVIDGDELTPTDVATALLEDDGTVVVITGVVSALNKYGDPFIQDSDGTAIIAEYFPEDVAVGDEIVVLGKLSTDTNYDERRRLEDPVLLSTTSTGNTVFVITDATADIGVADNSLEIANKLYQMDLTVAFEPGETSIFDNYGYVFFAANGDDVFKLDYEEYAPYFEFVYGEGDVLTMTFIISDIDYSSIRIIPTVLPTLTDAQNLAVAKGMLELDATATADLTLPVAMADYNATITWSSDTPAVISDAGVVVRPAEGAGDATVTLTATIDVNGTTDTKVFTITVPEDAPTMSFDFVETFTNLALSGTSYAAGSFTGDNSITWNYTESRGDFELTGQAIMLDKDGDGASLSATITGGIGAISIDFYDAYSGAAQVVIVINEGETNEVTYTSDAFDFDGSGETANFTVTDINVEGSFTITIYSGVNQMVLDNLSWTSYSAS
jgi:hypothetical protein